MPRARNEYSREFKLAALARFEACDNAQALARELGIRRELFYRWRDRYAAGGAEALRPVGRPRSAGLPVPAADDGPLDEARLQAGRIAALERKVGQQQLELDFFRAALRQVKGSSPRSGGRGGPASTR